jgi:RimJ/RimL family protein N-acetyltransferase
VIVGEKTRLRGIEREDIPTFVRWFNDPEVRRYLEMYLPMSKAEEEQWFEAHLESDSNRFFGIETGEGVLIGNVGLHSIDWKNRSAVLGIVIAEKENWGKGYGSDAITTLLRFVFGEMNLHRIHLSVFDFNERAIACYEKCGFRHEGRAREALYRDGSYHDALHMAILRQDFFNGDSPRT